MASTIIKDAKDTPQGDLVVTAPIAFGSTWLIERLDKFTDLHPGIHLHLYLDDREYDLLKLEAECAIRLWAADKADLIQRKLMSVKTSLYASPGYLEKNGTPQQPKDLDDHRIIVYGQQISPMHVINWAQRVGRDDLTPREASLTVNNVVGMVRAAEAGLGVADLPDYMIPDDSNLVKVLPEITGPHFDLYFIYPSDLRRSNRIAAFRDFLTSEIAQFQASGGKGN